MKMIGVLCALALCNVFVSGQQQFLGLEEPGGGSAGDYHSGVEQAVEPGAKDKDKLHNCGEKGCPPVEGPAHKDNLQDEIVDQADPEFDMLSGGDDCISWEDLKHVLDQQFEDQDGVNLLQVSQVYGVDAACTVSNNSIPEWGEKDHCEWVALVRDCKAQSPMKSWSTTDGATGCSWSIPGGKRWSSPGQPCKINYMEDGLGYGDGHCVQVDSKDECWALMNEAHKPCDYSKNDGQINEEIEAGMLADMKMQFEHADSNSDGCVNKAEFKVAKEMEGPPPGFEDEKLKDMSEEELTEEQKKQDRLEFDVMDDNKDGYLSQTEVYDFAANEMPAADINSDDIDVMFAAADTDKDGFITFEEFEGAGKEIEGDGNEMKNAKPMCSWWKTDKTMYTCKTVPKCCKGLEAKGISADTVQCVEKGGEKLKAKAKAKAKADYKVMCPKPKGPPTTKPPGGVNFKVFMLKRKMSNERVKVTMKMLAHKPPLKFLSSLLNRRK